MSCVRSVWLTRVPAIAIRSWIGVSLGACADKTHVAGDAAQTAAADGGGTAATTSGQPAASACAWPQWLDRDAGSANCFAQRELLSCELANGGGVICLSDDGEHCDDGHAHMGCHDVCGAKEYAVECGPLHDQPEQEDPPAGCHETAPIPGMLTLYCCPCS